MLAKILLFLTQKLFFDKFQYFKELFLKNCKLQISKFQIFTLKFIIFCSFACLANSSPSRGCPKRTQMTQKAQIYTNKNINMKF